MHRVEYLTISNSYGKLCVNLSIITKTFYCKEAEKDCKWKKKFTEDGERAVGLRARRGVLEMLPESVMKPNGLT